MSLSCLYHVILSTSTVILSEAKNLKTCSPEALASPGNRLVARMPFYGSLSAKRHPSPTRPTTARAINRAQQFPNARSPIKTNKSPQAKTNKPNLRVFLSLCHCQLMPLNATVIPKAIIAIAGAKFLNKSIITCGNHMLATSFVANHSTFSEGVEGEFKRGAAPLRALSTLSLDGRGSG